MLKPLEIISSPLFHYISRVVPLMMFFLLKWAFIYITFYDTFFIWMIHIFNQFNHLALMVSVKSPLFHLCTKWPMLSFNSTFFMNKCLITVFQSTFLYLLVPFLAHIAYFTQCIPIKKAYYHNFNSFPLSKP